MVSNRESVRRYQESEKGKLAMKKYYASPEYKLKQKIRQQSPEYKAYKKEYYSRPDVKLNKLEYARKYNETYLKREDVIQRNREYRKTEKCQAGAVAYRKSDRYRAMMERRRLSPNHRFREYVSAAKKRGINFNITMEQFMSFWCVPCKYCGSHIETIGLDRVDNSLGYDINNLVSCCNRCNKMKLTMKCGEFIDHCRKIVGYNGDKL